MVGYQLFLAQIRHDHQLVLISAVGMTARVETLELVRKIEVSQPQSSRRLHSNLCYSVCFNFIVV